MTNLFVIFWMVMVFTSIAWYGFLLFYIGTRGGKELSEMTRTLGKRGPIAKEEPKE
jgi:hypothetical protein